MNVHSTEKEIQCFHCEGDAALRREAVLLPRFAMDFPPKPEWVKPRLRGDEPVDWIGQFDTDVRFKGSVLRHVVCPCEDAEEAAE